MSTVPRTQRLVTWRSRSNDITGAGLGDFNTAVGAETLLSNTNGNSNNGVGAYALTANTTGVFNQAMGFSALGSNNTGSANIAVGDSALDSLTGPGSFNTSDRGFSRRQPSREVAITSILAQTSGGPAVRNRDHPHRRPFVCFGLLDRRHFRQRHARRSRLHQCIWQVEHDALLATLQRGH